MRYVRPVLRAERALRRDEGDVRPHDLDVTVGKGGTVTAVTAKPTTDSTSCVTEAAKAHTFTEPPKIPAEVFYTLRPEAR